MDGTLIDSEPYWMAAETELMRAHGVDWTHADGLGLIGNPLDVSAQVMIDRGARLPKHEIIDTLLADVAGKVAGHVPWQPDARALLDEVLAASIPCALVTMSYGAMTEAFLAAAPGVFDVVVMGDQVARGKPDPEGYLAAAQQLGVDVTRCIAIEDSPAGTAAAHASGAATIAVRRLAPLAPMPGLSRVRSLAGIGVEGLAAILAGEVRDELGDEL
jgi:beta-phosphoglucomutase-like phosphatase (HAD superfamily)